MKIAQLTQSNFHFFNFLGKIFHQKESAESKNELTTKFEAKARIIDIVTINQNPESKPSSQNIELLIQKQTSQSSNIDSSEFLLAIVHELKTPILSILGLADLLKDELKAIKTNKNFNISEFSQEFNEYVQDISLVASEMNELVGDIIDVKSAAFSKNFSVDLSQEIDLRNVIKRSVKLNYDYSLKRGVAIKTEIADDIKPIKLDAKRLKQILTNLISNAVKYSPKNSEVKITAKNLSQNNQEFLEICVIDQGFGMTETQIATAFEKYQTIQNPNSKSVDSFGLGLPIVKELVELQNGKIDVKSQVNCETKMKLTFPYLI